MRVWALFEMKILLSIYLFNNPWYTHALYTLHVHLNDDLLDHVGIRIYWSASVVGNHVLCNLYSLLYYRQYIGMLLTANVTVP